jgi:hypothetical protein
MRFDENPGMHFFLALIFNNGFLLLSAIFYTKSNVKFKDKIVVFLAEKLSNKAL